ncbi:nitroreductase family protein [Desulfosarcina sp. OttesenSCG-928-A07]|nr:nitroreductase family protein [Desulfosarcina sp. OttesenSCG-928-A07]
MTDLLEIIKNRRSIRKYESREISDALLDQVIEAFQWAPSWANTQCWELIVVRDPEIRKNLQEALPPKGNPGSKAIVEASAVLAICGKKSVSGYFKGEKTTKFGDWMLYDLGLATQNLCLMAHSLGLGTVIVGLFDHDKAAKAVNLPDGYELAVLVPIGYPAKSGGAPQRRETNDFVHQDTF